MTDPGQWRDYVVTLPDFALWKHVVRARSHGHARALMWKKMDGYAYGFNVKTGREEQAKFTDLRSRLA